MGGQVFSVTNPTDRSPRVAGPTASGMAGPNADRFGMQMQFGYMAQNIGLDEFVIHKKATGEKYKFNANDLNKAWAGGKGFKGRCY